MHLEILIEQLPKPDFVGVSIPIKFFGAKPYKTFGLMTRQDDVLTLIYTIEGPIETSILSNYEV